MKTQNAYPWWKEEDDDKRLNTPSNNVIHFENKIEPHPNSSTIPYIALSLLHSLVALWKMVGKLRHFKDFSIYFLFSKFIYFKGKGLCLLGSILLPMFGIKVLFIIIICAVVVVNLPHGCLVYFFILFCFFYVGKTLFKDIFHFKVRENMSATEKKDITKTENCVNVLGKLLNKHDDTTLKIKQVEIP